MRDENQSNPINPIQPQQMKPDIGALPLDGLSALLQYFQTTPMPHNQSHPFVKLLTEQVSLLNSEQVNAGMQLLAKHQQDQVEKDLAGEAGTPFEGDGQKVH